MDIEERITRIEDALYQVELILMQGNPGAPPEFEDVTANSAAWNFIQIMQEIASER